MFHVKQKRLITKPGSYFKFSDKKRITSTKNTVWLSQLELDELLTVNYQLTFQKEGPRNVSKQVAFYNHNLDMILAIGYRVRFIRGTEFRRYASTILKEHLVSARINNDDKITQDLDYFKKLQKCIREIRINERIFYKQVMNKVKKHFPEMKIIKVHDFRKTNASLLFESGASIKDVAQRLGHQSTKTTTDIYVKATPTKQNETINIFEKYMAF